MAGTGSGAISVLGYGGLSPTYYDGSYTGLAAAIAALGSNGGEIYIGPGTYTITSALTVNGPIRFVGGGWNTILSGANIFSFGSGSSGSEVTALRLNGSATTGTAITASQRIRVQNVMFSGTDASHGFTRQVEFTTSGADGSIVSDCHFERLQGTSAAYSVHLSGASYCRVINSYFTSTSGLNGVYVAGLTATGANFNLVSGCQFAGYVGSHVRISGLVLSSSPSLYNRIQGCLSYAALMTTETTSGAFQIGGETYNLAGGVTYLNVIDGCTVQGSGAYGIAVVNAKDNTVRNCIIQGSQKHGVVVDGAPNTMVKDVTVYDSSLASSNGYDGVNISNSSFQSVVAKSSNCCFENVMVRKSNVGSAIWRYAFNHIDSATATQAVALEFRDCQGIAGVSGTFNNIPSDARHVGSQVVDYGTGITPAPVFTGQVAITTPTAGAPLTVSGTSGYLQVGNDGGVVQTGTLELAATAGKINFSGSGTAAIQQTGGGRLDVRTGTSGSALCIPTDNTVVVGNTSNPGGQKLYVNGTSRLAGNTTVASSNLTVDKSFFASTTVQTVTNNATSQTLTGGKLVLSNSAGTNLATLTGSAVEGELLWVEATNGNTTLKDGTGNLYLAGDFTMTADDTILLRYSTTKVGWEEVARAVN